MSEITWDNAGTREYETGVDHGVLYVPDATGAFTNGVPWDVAEVTAIAGMLATA